MSDKTLRRDLTWLLCSSALATLTACGGGGGGGTPTGLGSTTSPAETTSSIPVAGGPASTGTGTSSTAVSAGLPADSAEIGTGVVTTATPDSGSTGSATSSATPSGAAGAADGTTSTANAGSTDAGNGGGSGGSSGSSASSSNGGSSNSSTTTTASSGGTSSGSSGGGSVLGDCPMFPSNAIFNTRIDDTSRFPAHANSNYWVSLVGSGTPFMPNWGNSSNPANLNDYWGIPINYVDGGSTQWPVVQYDYSSSGVSGDVGYPQKSDCATSAGGGITRDCSSVPTNARRFPFPAGQTLAEGGLCGGPNSCGTDHHVLVVEKGACRLWEAFYAHNVNGQWYALSTAAWDLRSNDMRPDDWSAADAAGLPVTPLLAKASEASTGEINHALRVTFRDAALAIQHTWPARFAAGGDNPGAIPFGAVLRLKADFVVPDSWDPQAKAVANAAKRYGLYVSDNGMDFFVQGEPSDGWSPTAWQQLRSISMGNMEFVDLKSVTGDPRFNPNSFQASW